MAIEEPWTTDTPVWFTDSGLASPGALGHVELRHRRSDGGLKFGLFVELATGFSAGVASWRFVMPRTLNMRLTADDPDDRQGLPEWACVGHMYDASAARRYPLECSVTTSVPEFYLPNQTNPRTAIIECTYGASGVIGPSVPVTWAAGDRLCVTGFVEALPN